jgi:hypothetical protein
MVTMSSLLVAMTARLLIITLGNEELAMVRSKDLVFGW